MTFPKFSAAIAAIALSGCTQDAATLSSFSSVSSTGVINSGLDSPGGIVVRDFSGDGYAYAAGSVDGDGLKATSGIISGSSVVPSTPTMPNATYTGRYELYRISVVDFDLSSISGFRTQQTGNISLDVDFENRTLIGSDGTLSVNGTFSGTALEGDVEYQGVNGDLRGLVGSDKAIGVFHGNNANRIFAGGFIVD